MSYIYFIQARENGPIKIGTTSGSPVRRMIGLQTGCPWPVKLIGAIKGTAKQERQIHNLLARFRTQGEWFEPHEIVLAAVKTAISCGERVDTDHRKIRRANGSDIDTAIEALGGSSAVAKIFGTKIQCVSNWRKRGTFPAKTFAVLNSRLNAIGFDAPVSLWPMTKRGAI